MADQQLVSEHYWSRHNVTNHRVFQSRDDSLAYFRWRNDQYFGYIDLMPVAGHDGKVVLDYGCGPGNDLVGFLECSRPAALYAADVSQPSLDEAMGRVRLHHGRVAPLKLREDSIEIPLENASVDYVHCSGVLMLVTEPIAVLKEFRRILKPDGRVRLMVYNYDSIWLHLYVAHLLMSKESRYQGLSLKEAFDRSTDGEDCPINRCWSVDEFMELGRESEFYPTHLGNAISAIEMSLLPQRFGAIMAQDLPREHREFLRDLTFDRNGRPLTKGRVAGIDGCFEFRIPD